MIEPMKHQARAKELFTDKSQLLAHGMGTGKSISAILIHQDRGAIIFCPAKLKSNWKTELEKMGELDVQVYKTKKDEFENQKWTICSYALADSLKDIAKKYTGMICDESHYIKGKSKRAKAVVNISRNMEVVTLLTGTAIMNKVIDLWNQLCCIKADITDRYNRTQFSQEFCGGHLRQMGRMRIWWEGGANNLELLKELIEPSVDIIRKSDVLDLEPKAYNHVELELTPTQRKEYKQKWNEYIEWVKSNPERFDEYTKIKRMKVDGKMTDVEVLVTVEAQIKNVQNSKQLVELGKLRQVTSKIKVEHFLTEVENLGGQQAVVFTSFIDSMETLNNGLKKLGVSYSTLKDEGSVEKFQNKEVQIFTANISSGAEGLNMQNASNVFILDRDWTPAKNEQAEDRVHRKGQTEQCTIHYYTCLNTIDEAVKESNEKKKKIADKIL